MKPLLSTVIILLSVSIHADQWSGFTTDIETNPMTDEVNINMASIELTSSYESTGSSIYIGCDTVALSATFRSNTDAPHYNRPRAIKIRFDREKPITLTETTAMSTEESIVILDTYENDFGSKTRALILGNTDVKHILDGLKTAQERLVYQINNGAVHVIPLNDLLLVETDELTSVSADTAIKTFEQHCPHYPETMFRLSP